MATINRMRLSYKIGFSSALRPGVLSAYAEMAKWDFSEERKDSLENSFCRGFADATRILKSVKIRNSVLELIPAPAASLFPP